MKLKTYLPLIVLTVCLVVVLCIGTSWIATPAARYSAAIGSTTPAQLNSMVAPTATFQSVTPDYSPKRNAARTQYSEPTATTTSGSVFSSTTFHQPQVTSFGGGGTGTNAGSSAQLAHAATSNTAPAAVSVSMPTPKRNSHATTNRTSDHQAAAAQQHSGATTYTAHALPMRSAGRSSSADASVAPLATTTYDDGYSINGSANQLSGRRNAGDDPFDGTLPENPKEPGVPMGDMPWALLLLLVAGYALRVARNAKPSHHPFNQFD